MMLSNVGKNFWLFQCFLAFLPDNLKTIILIFRYLSEHKTSCHSGKAGTNNFGSYHAYKKANSYYDMVKRENMDSTDLPDDLVHCPECAKPVKAKAIVIHFRRAHGRLPPGIVFEFFTKFVFFR